VASFLATLANPYGIALWSFLLRTAPIPRPEITEWQPLSLTTADGAIYLALLALTCAAMLASRRPRRPALIAVYLCVALLPLVAIRNLPLFCRRRGTRDGATLRRRQRALVWSLSSSGGQDAVGALGNFIGPLLLDFRAPGLPPFR
jgi:hypothetical protein